MRRILTYLLFRYYVDPPRIVVLGKPSGEMADRLDREEKARVAAQQERLGPAGIAECERELEAVRAEGATKILRGVGLETVHEAQTDAHRVADDRVHEQE